MDYLKEIAQATLPQTPKGEMVNHPSHYQGDNGVECIDAIQAALGTKETIAFCMGKAAWYIDKAISLYDDAEAVKEIEKLAKGNEEL